MNWLQSWQFYLRYAARSLRREGLRSVLAGLSIAFGVAAIVAMQTLAGVLHGTLFHEQLRYGGDAEVRSQEAGKVLSQAELDQIETWRQQGLISRYSPIANGTALYLRTPSSGRVTFLGNALGIDPAVYPLVGELRLREPAHRSPEELLHQPMSVLITRDLADRLGLGIGDPLLLGGGDVTPHQLTVVGIVQATPDQKGSTIFYTLQTAQQLEGRADVVTAVSVQWGRQAGHVADAAQTIRDHSFAIALARTPEEVVGASSGAALFDAMLKGAGVLGLLVGGLGVSNTLQVILARRKLEIAVLKTLGYRQAHLLGLIGLETGLLALISSSIGAGAGAALGGWLLALLSKEGGLLVDSTPDLAVMLGGILAGVATAIVFGLHAILALSATRPVEILRDLPVKPTRGSQIAQAMLFALFFGLFGGLVGWVLGSLWQGIAFVVGGGLLLLVLRTLFQWLLWIVLRIPIPLLPLLKMARANLKQRKAQASLILIALWAGVFAITLAAQLIHSAQTRLAEQRASDEGYNLLIHTTSADIDTVTQQLWAQNPLATYRRYQTFGTINGAPIAIEGRTPADLVADTQMEGVWDGADKTVLLPFEEAQMFQIGETVTLTGDPAAGAQAVTVEIAGFYRAVGDYDSNLSGVATGVIVSPQTALVLAGRQIRVSVVASFPRVRLDTATDALGLALPNALVISKVDLTNRLIAEYRTLFAFVVAVAGLAGVAGAVLIANAAGLAVVERRREIGVLKAIGYSSGQVLRILVSEYAFLGVLAGMGGLAAVLAVIRYINHAYPASNLVLEPRSASVMLVLSSLVAIVSATLVAWRPTRVRPLDVLRYE